MVKKHKNIMVYYIINFIYCSKFLDTVDINQSQKHKIKITI